MDITPAVFEIMVYIHPSQGPVKPIKLNMLDMEQQVDGIGSSSNRDSVRVEQTIKRIQAEFPGVRPYENVEAIRHFVRRLSHVALFNGVVLQLPGVIQDDNQQPPVDAGVVTQLEEKQKELLLEIDRLRARVQTLETDNSEKEKEFLDIQAKAQQHASLLQGMNTQIRIIEEERDAATEAREQALLSIGRVKDRAAQLEQENAELQLKEDQARHERSAYLILQSEVAELRVDKVNLGNEIEQLRLSLDRCKLEKHNLEERWQLRMQQERSAPPQAKIDDARQDWIGDR